MSSRVVRFLALAVAVWSGACGSGGGASLVGPPGDDDGSGSGSGSGADDAGTPPIDAPGPSDGPPPDPTDLAVICGGTAPVTLEDWENCYQKRKCEWEVGCPTKNPFRDVADCIASWDGLQGGKLAADRRDRKRAVAQGRAMINIAMFTQCLIRTSATRCNTALFDPACLTRFTGAVADTAGCLADIDCASPDAACTTTGLEACSVGACTRKFRDGENCQLFASCEPGLRCNGTKCVTGDIGTSCTKGSVNNCDFGTFCDPATLKCKATLATGAACTSLLQCGGDESCVGLSVSSSDPGHCMRVSHPGDHCDQLCYGNLYCDSGSGTCKPLPVLGQTCSLQIPCAGANTICNSGLCSLRSDVGIACGGQTCLPGLFCSTELGDPASTATCAARGAVDASCRSPNHCQSFLCSGTPSSTGSCLAWSDSCP